MNLKHHLRQTCSYQLRTGENEWGDASYAAASTLPCRKETRQRRVATPGGVEVTIDTIVLLDREVFTGDKIDGSEVQARENVVDFSGKVIGWRALL